MTHIYNISGMTCSGCQAKVQSVLSKVKEVKNVTVELSKGEAIIDMDKRIPTSELQFALKDFPKYQLTEKGHSQHFDTAIAEEETKPWIATYKPILLTCSYLLGVTILVEVMNGAFVWTRWIDHFMAGFFLVFSFFKLLDLKGFAESYATYDIIAKRWMGWGYVYAFIELFLGLSYLLKFNPLATNAVTFIVMSISIIGVLESVLNKRKIRCACLGAVFNLPMSTITISEDALMIGISAVMLLKML
jgi:cation transport ATPase